MGRNISLKSVMDFKNKNIHFFIPSYQRGYRWKPKQVEQLINDIELFTPTETNPFYFLQALAVAVDEDNNRVNVVDGQQRLTTLKLILGEENNDIKLSYAREADKALDKYFKETAKDVIKNRLGDILDSRRQQFCNKIRNDCKFLYYEVDSNKEHTTFYELNSGKIPAKDSELVKCVLLTIGNDESPQTTSSRAKEWDEIERMFNNDDFFSFMTPRNTWKEDDRITILLRYAGYIPSEKERNEETFPFLSKIQEELKIKSRKTVWKAICAAYYRLLEWYNDPVKYHAFGAIVHRRGYNRIDSIVEGLDFFTQIDKMANYIPNEHQNDYNKGGNALHHFLLLSNVAFCWKRWPNRYNFKKHREIDEWSLEHIFARNQRNLKEDELKEWLGDNATKDEIKKYKDACEQGKGDDWLAEKLGEQYPVVEDNSIKNLALLPKNANASLNNKLFQGKRAEICKWANNSWSIYWVPPITDAVFMKSLVGLNVEQPFWSEDDKNAYFTYMKNEIQTFVVKLKESTTL